MTLTVGEPPPVIVESNQNSNIQNTYAAQLSQAKAAANLNKKLLKPIEVIHGIPTIQFSLDERMEFAKEEGLHQAVVVKLSSNAPDVSTLRNLLPKFFGIKGQALIGQLAPRQLLIRIDQHDDFVNSLGRSVNYFKYNDGEHQIIVFPWSVGFNVKEEPTKAVVWISLPNLPTELFAMKALLSIASAVGKPIAIDKATQTKSRASTARVKAILDLMGKLPHKLRLQFLDKQMGRMVEVFQDFVYDNLPLYCNHCKHQGHDEKICHRLNENAVGSRPDEEHAVVQSDEEILVKEGYLVEKYQGDLRQLLNEKRRVPSLIEAEGVESIHHISDGAQVLSKSGNQSAIGEEMRMKDIPTATISSRMLTTTSGALKNSQMQNVTAGTLNASGDVSSGDLNRKSAGVVQRQEDRATTFRDAGQNKKFGAAKSVLVPGVNELHGNHSDIEASDLEAIVPLNTTGDQTLVGIATSYFGTASIPNFTTEDGQAGKNIDRAASMIDDTGAEVIVNATVVSMGDAANVKAGALMQQQRNPSVLHQFAENFSRHPAGHIDDIPTGQVLTSPRKFVKSPNKSVTRNKDWTEVNQTSGKKQSPGIQNQVLPSNTIGVSNSFDALVVEHDHDVKKYRNKVQQG
ncbi:uncharacterized protein [Nicotiana tomentosiformis]|uniref:uncharacterized protein n=1 Tax=Nicotiana tomentosiformis TaxID=4098 RepID=UPI00051B302D|nr:uncharacterized protein LOC104099212 [Nicotiana tomentosiformis]